jgi:hypothetical protein
MIALAIATLNRPLVLVISNQCRCWAAKVRQRDRGGWQMPADRAFALR